MKRGIVMVAALLLVAQHMYLLAFGMKEGLSVLTLLFVLPLGAALALLFLVHHFLRLTSSKKEGIVLALLAALLLVLGELFLPVSPFKTTYVSHMTQQTIDAIVVTDIEDRMHFTASGSPIAVEVSYRTEVPRTGAYSIYPTGFTPDDDTLEPYAVQLSTMAAVHTTPEPKMNEDGTRIYEQGISYLTRLIMKPNFVQYNDYTETFCTNIDAVLSEQFTQHTFASWIATNSAKTYRFAVVASGNSYFTQGKSVSHTTTNAYAIREFHKTAVSELAPCGRY